MRKSFAEWGIEKYGENFLDKYWDYEKNESSPYEISYSSNKKIWIKCRDKDYHGSYKMSCNHFTNGQRCSYCHPKKESHYFDSLGFLYHDIARMIVEDERNGLTYKDTYKIIPNSHKKYYIKCSNCGCKSIKDKQLNSIIRQGYSCEYCSDGVSTPEKFITNLLKYLKLDFNTQSVFNWSNNKRYDFYIPSLNIIIETHGKQHYLKNVQTVWNSLEEEQENDNYKKQLALSNGIENYIVIDCRESTLEWLKENTIKELGNIFSLKDVDWKGIYCISQKNKIVEAWNLWNEGKGLKEIADILNVHYRTVSKYLCRGNEMGKCSYNSEEYRIKKVNEYHAIKVKILYPNGNYEEFNTMKDFLKKYEITKFCFDKYIKPYEEINLNNIPINGYTKDIREKLKNLNGCKLTK